MEQVSKNEELRARLEDEIQRTEKGIKVLDWSFEIPEIGEVKVFVRTPNRYAKNAAIDAQKLSETKASELLFSVCLIKEHTDSRVTDDNPENDRIYYAVLMKMDSLIDWYSIDFLKKK